MTLGRFVAVGECMLELSGSACSWRLSHGGDCYNTAVYLARWGVDAALLTALGADPFSERLRASWAAEGFDLELVLTAPDRLPGLYAIETDDDGERRFFYWRERSAARALFELPQMDRALDRAAKADTFFISGITLSLFNAAGRSKLRGIADVVRARGGRVVLDPNYRASGWPGPQAARAALLDIAPHVSMVLASFADEETLWGDRAPGETLRRWQALGPSLVIVKDGGRGAWLNDGTLVATEAVPDVVDTSGAGDAFNAAFLARLDDVGPAKAASAGHRLAALVVASPGAVLPRERTPALFAL